MAHKHIRMAMVYDFDGTLSPSNMQEFNFIPKIGMTKQAFWSEVNQFAVDQKADKILAYMRLMLWKANVANIRVQRNDFIDYGKTVKLFKGVEDWFQRINKYGKDKNIKIEHFIISSGIREMIAGTSIARHFKAIFASSFMYDRHDVAFWPALAINYTTKTQYLFRINKGNLKVHDDSKINEYIPKQERPVPFENMVFIGDGETDIPCFRLVKDQGGQSIAVYKPKAKGAKTRASQLIEQGRVNFAYPADYSSGSAMDKCIKAIVDKVSSENILEGLAKQN